MEELFLKRIEKVFTNNDEKSIIMDNIKLYEKCYLLGLKDCLETIK